MALSCVTCGEPIEAGDYQLVGVEQGSWASLYAHRGSCEETARQRFSAARTPAPKRKRLVEPEPEPIVEELTLEEPDPFPGDGLPWQGMGRRG